MSKLKQTKTPQQPNRTYNNVSADTTTMVRQLGNALHILRMKQLVLRTGLSRATLYALKATDPTFPQKIQLTERAVGYLESEVDAWIATRVEPRFLAQ